MIKMINKLTGGEMWVAEERLEEYTAAGHKLAAVPSVPEPVEAKKPKAKSKAKSKAK